MTGARGRAVGGEESDDRTMNSLAPLLEQFTLPEISSVLRRTVLIALAVGVVAIVATLFLGAVLGGLGACIGLFLGLVNIRLVTTQTAKVTRTKPATAVPGARLA